MHKMKGFKTFNGEPKPELSERINVVGNTIDLERLQTDPVKSITIWGGDKMEQMFRDAFEGMAIPKLPDTGDVTFDGNKIGFIDNFAGLVFTDINWVQTHLDAINEIVKVTGFWYG